MEMPKTKTEIMIFSLAIVAASVVIASGPVDWVPDPIVTLNATSPDARNSVTSSCGVDNCTLAAMVGEKIKSFEIVNCLKPAPRFLLIDNGGNIALIDTSLNVFSSNAAVLIKHSGSLTIIALDKLLLSSGVTRRQIARKARYGAWLSEKPTVGKNGLGFEVTVGGHVVELALE